MMGTFVIFEELPWILYENQGDKSGKYPVYYRNMTTEDNDMYEFDAKRISWTWTVFIFLTSFSKVSRKLDGICHDFFCIKFGKTEEDESSFIFTSMKYLITPKKNVRMVAG